MIRIYSFITIIYIIPLNVGLEITPFSPPIVSNECMNLELCETVENYPTDLAIKLIEELKDNHALIVDDPIVPTTQEHHRIMGGSIHTRISYDQDENSREQSLSGEDYMETPHVKPLCESTVMYQRPKVAKNKDNEYKFILNDEHEPFQTFRLERCDNDRGRCSSMIQFISNYESVCVQKWILKEMYFINDDRTIGTDYFKVPSCCTCKLHRINK